MALRVIERQLLQHYSELAPHFTQALAEPLTHARLDLAAVSRALATSRPRSVPSGSPRSRALATARHLAATLHRAGMLGSGTLGVQFLPGLDGPAAIAVPQWGQIFLAPRVFGQRQRDELTQGYVLHELLHVAAGPGVPETAALAEATTGALVLGLMAHWHPAPPRSAESRSWRYTHRASLGLPVVHAYMRLHAGERRPLSQWLLGLQLREREVSRLEQQLRRRLSVRARRRLSARSRLIAKAMAAPAAHRQRIHEYCGHGLVDQLVLSLGVDYLAVGVESDPALAFLRDGLRLPVATARGSGIAMFSTWALRSMLEDTRDPSTWWPPESDR